MEAERGAKRGSSSRPAGAQEVIVPSPSPQAIFAAAASPRPPSGELTRVEHPPPPQSPSSAPPVRRRRGGPLPAAPAAAAAAAVAGGVSSQRSASKRGGHPVRHSARRADGPRRGAVWESAGRTRRARGGGATDWWMTRAAGPTSVGGDYLGGPTPLSRAHGGPSLALCRVVARGRESTGMSD